MSETPETRHLERGVTVVKSPLETPLSTLRLNTRWSKTRTRLQRHRGDKNKLVRLSFELEIRGYRLLQNARVSREERQMVLAGTRNDMEYTAIVTQLRGALDDQDLFERDRGGKSFGKDRTVHFAEADTEWYAEQIAHSISGDATEIEVTWSFDPDEATWWCGVLDPSIPEPDVMDWSEDWSYSESSPYAEDVFPEQPFCSNFILLVRKKSFVVCFLSLSGSLLFVSTLFTQHGSQVEVSGPIIWMGPDRPGDPVHLRCCGLVQDSILVSLSNEVPSHHRPRRGRRQGSIHSKTRV